METFFADCHGIMILLKGLYTVAHHKLVNDLGSKYSVFWMKSWWGNLLYFVNFVISVQT